jgi:transcriptional regulator with XRE-family HTH domain
MNYLSANIKHLRRIKGLSQAELAKNFGKKQNTIGNWENGISEPSIKELVILSQIFMVDMASLVNRNLEHGEEPGAEHPSDETTEKSFSLVEQDKQLEGFWLTLRELRKIQEKLDRLINGQGGRQPG